MRLSDYQAAAMSFRLKTADTWYSLVGISGEVGELHSLVAKSIRDETHVDREVFKKELGDILWFVAALADDCGFGLDEIALANIEKLNSRKSRDKIKGSGDDR